MASAEGSKGKKPLLIRAAWGEQVERPPVWVMRQAGRYLPEYHEAKRGLDFFGTCRDAEVASELTVQPVDRYEGLIDAAIIFSDILVIPQALGMEVTMVDKVGPGFPDPIKTPADLSKLKRVEEIDEALVDRELGYVMDAIRATKRKLRGRVPLIGFCGAPWTLAAYMIDRGGSKTFHRPTAFLRKHPDAAHDLLARCTAVAIPYLVKQVQAGAELLQVFDSWAGELAPADFDEFALPYLRQIAEGVDRALDGLGIERVPKTVFAKGAWFALDKLCDIGYQVVGLDWTHDPAEAVRIAAGRVTLQGNMNPCWLIAGKDVIDQQVKRMVQGFGGGKKGYIANLGHGIFPEVDPDDLKTFFECIHKYGSQ
ncbi:Uroporphyrinogen decarboxylase in heme biosynthesis [Savitreella phatthalungensis]